MNATPPEDLSIPQLNSVDSLADGISLVLEVRDLRRKLSDLSLQHAFEVRDLRRELGDLSRKYGEKDKTEAERMEEEKQKLSDIIVGLKSELERAEKHRIMMVKIIKALKGTSDLILLQYRLMDEEKKLG